MSRDDQDEVVIEQLEEGEISDHSDIDYTPLERPDNYSNLKNDTRFSSISIVQDSDSEDQKSSELDSDSDSAGPRSRKTKKLKLKVKPPPQKRPINNRFNIWSTRVQEDVLSETLNSCDVTKKDRSRSVESYDYVASARYQNMMNGGSYKRTREDRKNIHLRLRNCSYNLEQKPLKGKTRNILDLVTTLENSVEEIAEDISNKLYEEKEDLIYDDQCILSENDDNVNVKILNIIGKQKCLEIFQETQNIEANGGMLIMNQTRRRTPGGVFLYLVRCREDITREEKHKIFHDERKISRNDLKERRKMKIEKLRKQTAEERAKLLPELFKRAEELMKDRLKKEINASDVINPPPTPETDGHDNSDDTENLANLGCGAESPGKGRGELTMYEDDFLDLQCSNNEMDLF